MKAELGDPASNEDPLGKLIPGKEFWPGWPKELEDEGLCWQPWSPLMLLVKAEPDCPGKKPPPPVLGGIQLPGKEGP